MRILFSTAALALALTFSAGAMAQQTNDQARQDAAAQAQQDHNADKAQAKADKAEHKELKSKKAKKAARKQDRADREAARTPEPQ